EGVVDLDLLLQHRLPRRRYAGVVDFGTGSGGAAPLIGLVEQVVSALVIEQRVELQPSEDRERVTQRCFARRHRGPQEARGTSHVAATPIRHRIVHPVTRYGIDLSSPLVVRRKAVLDVGDAIAEAHEPGTVAGKT